jgi:hypothetical protein
MAVMALGSKPEKMIFCALGAPGKLAMTTGAARKPRALAAAVLASVVMSSSVKARPLLVRERLTASHCLQSGLV